MTVQLGLFVPQILNYSTNITILIIITVGTVGFIGTNYFVRKIYSTVKID